MRSGVVDRRGKTYDRRADNGGRRAYNGRRRFARRSFLGLRGYFGLIVVGLLLSTGLGLAGLGYVMLTRSLEAAVERRIDSMGRDIKRDIVNGIRRPAQTFLSAFTKSPLAMARTRQERASFLPLVLEVLRSNSAFGSVIVSYDNDEIFMAKLLHSERERAFFGAPPEPVLLVMEIFLSGPLPACRHSFYNLELRLLSSREDGDAPAYILEYERDWRQAAMQAAGTIETAPLIVASSNSVSMIRAQKSPDGRAVVALAIRLDHLSSLMAGERPTPGSFLALFQADGHLIAADRGLLYEENGRLVPRGLADLDPVVRLGVEKYRQGQRTTGLRVGAGAENTGLRILEKGRDWLLVLEELDDNDTLPGDFLVMAIPWNEITFRAGQFLLYAMLGMGGLLLLLVPVIWLVARHVSTPLRLMAERTKNMNAGRGAETKATPSLVPEIDNLMQNVDFMRENQRKILSVIGLICGDRDFETLPGRVLKEIMTITEADGGIIMMMDESKRVLEKGWFCWDDGEVQSAAMPGHIPWETYAIFRAVSAGRSVADRISRDDPRAGVAPVAPGFAEHPDENWLRLVSLPLKNRMGDLLGGLTLLKRGELPDEPELVAEQVTFMETLVAAAAMVLETQDLLKSQYDLRDALIRILAGAIDTKSPHTGGHCARVPVIFQMLLEAAHEAEDGQLKDFRLDAAGREEARLAAWLHDCGKVTTPEYVMDKATKLETFHDRIHEIRTRFEVLKRDAEIAGLKARLNGADPGREQRKLAKALAKLDEDFAFVAACNLGGEHMDDAVLERLAIIGARPWLRTLDKRLGVSRDELGRMLGAGVPDAPAPETLLMDNPEHIIPRGEKDRLPGDNPWGFCLDMPNALYNRGELYNLRVRRGTLTVEERYKINDHITRTIMMLEDLPLPKSLSRVPEIAGAHHETMDGRGYPRRRKREEMSWEARMMAIADIFEALTAWDRPYKASKTLRESLEIMEIFKLNNHIDPHLYELFLAADIPGRYAAEYLKPEQNDLGRH